MRAYQAILAEGSALGEAALLNRDLLLAICPELSLPDRVRLLWEERFPLHSSAPTRESSGHGRHERGSAEEVTGGALEGTGFALAASGAIR